MKKFTSRRLKWEIFTNQKVNKILCKMPNPPKGRGIFYAFCLLCIFHKSFQQFCLFCLLCNLHKIVENFCGKCTKNFCEKNRRANTRGAPKSLLYHISTILSIDILHKLLIYIFPEIYVLMIDK